MTACERTPERPPVPTPSIDAQKPPPVPKQNGVDPEVENKEKPTPKPRAVKAAALGRFVKDVCPPGYKSSPMERNEAGAAGAVASQARRDCRKGKQTLVLTLTDFVGAEGMVGPIRQLGKLKPYPGNGDGFFEYDKTAKKGRAQLVVGNRYVFGAVADQATEKELRAALGMFDVTGLDVYKPSVDDLLAEPK